MSLKRKGTRQCNDSEEIRRKKVEYDNIRAKVMSMRLPLPVVKTECPLRQYAPATLKSVKAKVAFRDAALRDYREAKLAWLNERIAECHALCEPEPEPRPCTPEFREWRVELLDFASERSDDDDYI